MRVKRALVSVSDKTGLDEFVKVLDRLDVEIISTGGTAKFIGSLGIPVAEISSYTGYPEMLDGRVKTLHPVIHAGLLSVRDNKKHAAQMQERKIPYIDMVVVNLYPFEKVTSREEVTSEEAIENIDIGGPSMLRSAAKNFKSVAVISSPEQYEKISDELEKNKGELSDDTLKDLAIAVFDRISRYNKAIYRYLSGKASTAKQGEFPDSFKLELEKVQDLRYGENPHQKAAFYRDISSAADEAAGKKLQGKELSFNNMVDISAAMEIVNCFSAPAVSIVKHNNPCGSATADTLEEAYVDALDCDRTSAFGGIMAFNRSIGKKMAELILGQAHFIECIIAPGYENAALGIFKDKKNLRVLKTNLKKKILPEEKDIKRVSGGFLLQTVDRKEISREDLKIVTKRKPSKDIIDSLIFAWKIVKYVRSNAVVICRGTKTVGIGAGQMSRVDSVMTAIRKAGERSRGSVLASDAFFPMPDSIEKAHKAGIAAVIQPGGSIRDGEIIAACDKFGIAMVFTGTRHFKH